MVSISKITRGGQITLPIKIRTSRAFQNSTAVMFEERKNEIVIRPLKSEPASKDSMDHWPFVEHTMRDWLDSVNDDLFKAAKDI